MIHVTDQQVASLLSYTSLIDALETAFRTCKPPPRRLQYAIGAVDKIDGHLLLMPAWRTGGKMGIKIVSVFPQNATQSLPTVNATYLLLDATTGVVEMILDATELTRRRTAAVSALAARYLARPDSKVLLMVGTGAMSIHLIAAHCANQALEKVLVWGRRPERARAIAEQFVSSDVVVEPVTDLQQATMSADIISCATLAKEPLVKGEWLQAGQHLDLVGSFTPSMREVDDSVLRLASIYVDTRSGALREAGELVQGLREEVIEKGDIRGDLFQLTRHTRQGRQNDTEITLFKSVGTSLVDLAAAELAAARFHALRHHSGQANPPKQNQK